MTQASDLSESAIPTVERQLPDALPEESPSLPDPKPVTEDVEEQIDAGLSQGDRRFLFFGCLLILILAGANFVRVHWIGPPRLVLERVEPFQIDINQAGWVEWMQLPEIGETTARGIVADREANGAFSSIDDLRRVKGIGPATMKKIRPYLRLESVEQPISEGPGVSFEEE